eukprot:2570412-Rhodomonas_salina.1
MELLVAGGVQGGALLRVAERWICGKEGGEVEEGRNLGVLWQEGHEAAEDEEAAEEDEDAEEEEADEDEEDEEAMELRMSRR